MVVLGIDPGLAIVGYGIVSYSGNKFSPVTYGAVTTHSTTLFSDRLQNIYAELSKIIQEYKPDAMVIEELFFNTNTKTAIMVAQARGVILLCGKEHNLPIYEYTPLQVKQAVTGYGRADKKQVQYMTKALLNLEKAPKPDDTADALALAICHCHSNYGIIKMPTI